MIILRARGWELVYQHGPGWGVRQTGTAIVPFGSLASALWGSGLPREVRRDFRELLQKSGLHDGEPDPDAGFYNGNLAREPQV